MSATEAALCSDVPATVSSPSVVTAGFDQRARAGARNEALDFTKGTLVLTMVLYHWLNYFVDVQWDVYRYLRFLTPSFIFITGFIISNVYLARAAAGDRKVYLRLLSRGAKLLLLFTLLNVLAGLVIKQNYNGTALGLERFTSNLYGTYVAGDGKAIFDVLVPISYVLMLSPLVIMAARRSRLALYACGVFALALTAMLGAAADRLPNVELMSIAGMGLMVGAVSSERIEALLRRPLWIAIAYVGYLVAITRWNVVFALQVVGVCLSLLGIYYVGVQWTKGPGRKQILQLGTYSLLAYIVQVVVLQILRRGLHGMDLLGPLSLIPLTAALILTVGAIKLVEAGRVRWRPVDQTYRMIFG